MNHQYAEDPGCKTLAASCHKNYQKMKTLKNVPFEK